MGVPDRQVLIHMCGLPVKFEFTIRERSCLLTCLCRLVVVPNVCTRHPWIRMDSWVITNRPPLYIIPNLWAATPVQPNTVVDLCVYVIG